MERKRENVERMFDSIASDYDKLNHIMSAGVDRTWRSRALKHIIDRNRPQQILDIACGTGDFSIAIARDAHEKTFVQGLDLSEGMLEVMGKKVAAIGMADRIKGEKGDCEEMRFADNTFDCATIAFGIRNFEHREKALKEILRVLKDGGRLVILELSVPENKVLRWCFKQYFARIVPIIGGIISGDKSAYTYLPESVFKFPGRKEWMQTMRDCGYVNVQHKAFTLGICRMYVGEKVAPSLLTQGGAKG